ncbi:MAG: cytochrome c [Bacteroidetes bacterium]|nr:cytochrome c [Bacteroidota bacterium]
MLKKILKWTGIVLLVLIIGLTIAVATRQNLKHDAPYPEITLSTDSAVLARGEYLVYGPGHCADCHGDRSLKDKIEKGEKVPLIGGFQFVLPVGNMYAPNITPDKETGIGNLETKAMARALRYGVRPDGTAMFDFMPFHNTSDADLTAIFSYLKTMEPVKHEVPHYSLNVLGKIVNAFMIKPTGPSEEVPKSVTEDTSIAYGKYLANSVANCRGCHTNRDLMTGAFIGPDYAGGFEMESLIDPKHFKCVTPNLTPDPETGHLAGWNETTFINRFRMGKLIKHSEMPWGPFSRMSDNNLKAIYRYLQTVKPVKNKVEKTLVEINA